MTTKYYDTSIFQTSRRNGGVVVRPTIRVIVWDLECENSGAPWGGVDNKMAASRLETKTTNSQ